MEEEGGVWSRVRSRGYHIVSVEVDHGKIREEKSLKVYFILHIYLYNCTFLKS